jgi:NADPH:quinone reductase-like Zn-dependent oxidoreductase
VATETVKIVRFHQVGSAEVLQLDELPIPEPGAGEVRLRVKAIGLNRAEVMFRQGKYLVAPKFPSKLGYEASGVVEAVGSGVDRAWLGKTVSTVPAFPADKYGVYGEVAIVPASALAEYPAHLSFEEGTSIWMQYLTAYGALVMHGKAAKGDFVLLTAASSSVGLAAIEIVKAENGVSIAATRTSRKKAQLLAAGADHVIATGEEDLAARVHEITAGKGARIIFDPIAGSGVETLAAAASPGGTISPANPLPFRFSRPWARASVYAAIRSSNWWPIRRASPRRSSMSSTIWPRAVSSRASIRAFRWRKSSRRIATWNPTSRSAKSWSRCKASFLPRASFRSASSRRGR